MNTRELADSLQTKRTWVRVVEISSWWNKDKKKFLFRGGGPVPDEDKLPMAICNIQIALVIATVVLIALNVFSSLANIMLGLVLLIIMFLPSVLAQVNFKNQ
jgi:hypothetical protein